MNKIQAISMFTGFILVFGAVGGMEDPAKAEFFFYQLGTALLGLFMMFMAVITTGLTVEVTDE